VTKKTVFVLMIVIVNKKKRTKENKIINNIIRDFRT